MSVQAIKPFQSFAALQQAKEFTVNFSQYLRIQFIKALPEPGVTGNLLYTVQALQIRTGNRFLMAVLIKLEQRGILETKQRQP